MYTLYTFKPVNILVSLCRFKARILRKAYKLVSVSCDLSVTVSSAARAPPAGGARRGRPRGSRNGDHNSNTGKWEERKDNTWSTALYSFIRL